MSYLIFFCYLILLSWLLTKSRFIINSGIGTKIILILFFIKVIAGLVSGGIIQHNIEVDTWKYHLDALDEYHLLWNEPAKYFGNLFQTGYSYGYQGLFGSSHSYWNDLKTNLIVKFVSVLDIFSFGIYYTNVILYNFLTFFGQIALFRFFSSLYKNQHRILIVICFLLPSLLYYSSTIHKDGIILSALGFVVYFIYQGLVVSGFTFKKWVIIIFNFILIFLFRSYICLALLPALLALFITVKQKYPAYKVFSLVYLVVIFFFFLIPFLFPSINLPELLVAKQSEFLNLKPANTSLKITILEPHFSSYCYNFPQAILNGFFRPLITDVKYTVQLIPFIFELMIYQVLILIYVFNKNKYEISHQPFILFTLIFGLSICLFIGYSVPIIGAIVRYRSIYLPFILSYFVCNTNWQKWQSVLQIKK